MFKELVFKGLIMKGAKILVCFISFIVFVSCSQNNHISVVSYNAQTFFDAINDGREFKEFKKKENFGENEYNERLTRLIKAVKMCAFELTEEEEMPDILVLQEIESATVLKDLCKRLNVNDEYKDFVFLDPEKGGAFNTAILSKHEVLFAKAHNVHSSEKVLRPSIETDIAINANGQTLNITLFGVHWKSKRDGSKDIRLMQEELLYKRMKEREKTSDYVIACGDFNQDKNDFSKMNYFCNAWDLSEELSTIADNASDSELDDELNEIEVSGSYCYKGKWERLDNIFYSASLDSKKIQACKFAVAKDSPLVFEGNINRYNVGTKQGYSDHLPIGLLLEVL